jgi:signal transduction histidine kinase
MLRMRAKFYKRLSLILILLIIGVWISLQFTIRPKHHNVLVVQSFEQSYAIYPELNKLIKRNFKKSNIDADIRVVYLDCENYGEPQEQMHLHQLINSATSDGWKPDIILANDDQGTYSLLKSEHPLIYKVPIVFAGVNYPNWKLISKFPNVRGIEDNEEILKNIYFIKQVVKKKPWIYACLDSTFIDKKVLNDVKTQLKGRKYVGITTPNMPIAEQWRLCEKEGYTLVQLFRTREHLAEQKDTYLWPLIFYYNKASKNARHYQINDHIRGVYYLQFRRDYTTKLVNTISADPIFSAINEHFGYYDQILGGYMSTIQDQAKQQVDMAVKILNGTPLSKITFEKSIKHYVVDWRVMRRFDIPEENIPSGVTIVNQPFDKAHPIIWTTGLSIIIVAVIWLIILYTLARRKKLQLVNDLIKEREMLSLATQSSGTFVWSFGKGLFHFEKAFWNFLKIEPRDISIDEMMLYVHPDYRHLYKKLKLSLQDAMSGNIQLPLDFDGYGYSWWEARFMAHKTTKDEYVVYGIIINITDIKKHEKELEDARRLAEKAELKQSFIENMSHEIRTPLNAIIGFTNLLINERGLTPEEVQEYQAYVSSNNELLLEMIDDIIFLSRLDSGHISFVSKPCNVKEFIENIHSTKNIIPARLEFRLEEGLPPNNDFIVYVDPIHLRNAIIHLLQNAAKFTESGYVKLGYHYMQHAKQVHIFIEDSGIGIPQEEIKMIFERFYKNDKYTQGTGLGLSICKILIEKMGGTIDVESEVGKGSTFSIYLPCERPK